MMVLYQTFLGRTCAYQKIMNALIEDLRWRGLVAQCSDEDSLVKRLNEGAVSLYAGFDPTAESLHVGNLIPLIALARFQRAGHRVIALVGGATGMIGDPSGKALERVLESESVVAHRASRIAAQLGRVLNLSSSESGVVVNNLDWTANVSVLDFLRDVGKQFSVNAMLSRDSVRSRLDREGAGISFTEFSYMLLQAFDFMKLAEREGCVLQVGGSDQWGNMCSGADLIRRKLNKEAFALTFPLLTTHDGQKFGKSVKGAVWLDARLTSVWDFFQFWLNTADQDVIRLLKLFTFLSRPEIEALEQEVETCPQARKAQRCLAFELTAMIHGEDAALAVTAAARVLFEKACTEELTVGAWEALAESVPTVRFRELSQVPAIAPLLVAAGLESSNTRAAESLRAGAVSLNNLKVGAGGPAIGAEQLRHGRYLLLRKGKRHFAVVVVGG